MSRPSDKARNMGGRLFWCSIRESVTTCGGSLLDRLSPAFLVSSNSLASLRLLAAIASRGDKVGGTSPSKCCMRGEM